MTTTALLVNPNTSAWVTRRLAVHLRRQWRGDAAASGIALATATARFGASYIASEAGFAIAAHAALDAAVRTCDRADARRHAAAGSAATAAPPFAAVLVGCFGDPGLFALRSILPMPVIGLAQAAFDEAAGHGRFAVVTGGKAWQPMLERIVRAFGHDAALTRIVVIERSGAELAADPGLARTLLAAAGREAAAGDSDCVVLGGAAFAGYGDAIASEVGVPVVDSVSAAGRALAATLRLARGATAVAVDGASYRGLHPVLARWVTGDGASRQSSRR